MKTLTQQISEAEANLNGYIAFYGGKQHEIRAKDLYSAKLKAIADLKIPKSKQGLLAIELAELKGKQVSHSTAKY